MPVEAIQLLNAWETPTALTIVSGFADRLCPHCPNVAIHASLGEPCDECKVGIYRDMRDEEYTRTCETVIMQRTSCSEREAVR